MAFLEWDQELDVHVDKMNQEHIKLIEYMNIVYDKSNNNAPKPEISQALSELANYTVQHFKDEEAYMESIAFPKLDSHKLIHKDLLKKVTAYINDFEKGDGSLPKEFFNFLKLWLLAHIKGIDVKYGDFASAKSL